MSDLKQFQIINSFYDILRQRLWETFSDKWQLQWLVWKLDVDVHARLHASEQTSCLGESRHHSDICVFV